MGFGEDGLWGLVGVAFLQAPGSEQGSQDALGLAPPLRTGTATDLPAHHRRGFRLLESAGLVKPATGGLMGLGAGGGRTV